jgi:hypothetical protein
MESKLEALTDDDGGILGTLGPVRSEVFREELGGTASCIDKIWQSKRYGRVSEDMAVSVGPTQ